MQTGAKSKNKPKSILEEMLKEKKGKDLVAFDSGEAFDAARERILKKVNK